MDSLSDILSQKDFSEPPEIAAIKQYIQERFQTAVNILVSEREVIVAVPNASLANTLRLRSPELQKLCPEGKRLRLRIG